LRVEWFVKVHSNARDQYQRNTESESYDTANLHLDVSIPVALIFSVILKKVRLGRTFFSPVTMNDTKSL